MQRPKKNWTSIIFLTVTPILGVGGTLAYALVNGVLWWQPVLLLISYLLVGLSITVGYHRYFSHRAYETHPVIESILLFFGAWAFENSALKWSNDHRNHHRFVDTDKDPYNIKKGGWWAHIFWVFYDDPEGYDFSPSPDLLANPRVMWQHKYHALIAVIFGLGLPTLVGALFGHPLAGLLWGGLLRVVIIHHTTFFVNSLAHLYGSRPYTDLETARDNFLVALVTNGEGYHNFHHKFPSDYRNGIKWYQFDPGKWIIQGMHAVGLVRNRLVTPQAQIEKAKWTVASRRAETRMHHASVELRDAIQGRLEKARLAIERAAALWNEALAHRRARMAEGKKPAAAWKEAWRHRVADYRAHLKQAREEKREALKMLARLPAAA
jgi:stearoyl-CoA desaturase (delta-9 desaturase)